MAYNKKDREYADHYMREVIFKIELQNILDELNIKRISWYDL